MTCRLVFTVPAPMVDVQGPEPSEVDVQSTHYSENRSEVRPTNEATTRHGKPEGETSSAVTVGASAASVQQKRTIESASRKAEPEAGARNKSTLMRTFARIASRVTADARRWINRVGVLLAPSRNLNGGGTTILPHGRNWKRHVGRKQRQRGQRQQTRVLLAELDSLEQRYRKLTGQ